MRKGENGGALRKFPPWISKRFIKNENYEYIDALLKTHKLNTVCKSAKCPNIFECFSQGHLTFMIMGNSCTRGCLFCGIENKQPLPVDAEEPRRIAESCKLLGLKYVVITSPCRDDLDDKGAGMFSETINEIKGLGKNIEVEVLVPDFGGEKKLIEIVCNQKPDIFAHNLETVKRLHKPIRKKADYDISLSVIKYSKQKGCITKSGIMLGLGEKEKEIISSIKDLKENGCDILTIGQYLSPSSSRLKVKKYYSPFEFDKYKIIAKEVGFSDVRSGPFVRSSYKEGC